MTILTSGTWPIDPTITNGTDLAAYLNEWVEAFNSNLLSNARPPTLNKGGIWTKTLGATDIALMLNDGAVDRQIASIIGGVVNFGGDSATTPPPATPT